MELSQATFDGIRRIVRKRAGIDLHDGKRALVRARLASRIRALGLSGYGDYLAILRRDDAADEYERLLDAITTNVSHFFRGHEQISVLVEAFERKRAAGAKRFRYWSAGCARGEEPYSLAMALVDAGGAKDVRVLATDVSGDALRVAMRGVYPADALHAVPRTLLARYLPRARDEELPKSRPGEARGAYHSVAAEVRARVVFRQHNLSVLPLPLRGPLDAVLCCNVMIYFHRPLRARLVDEMCSLLAPGGHLVVGKSESLVGMDLPEGLVRVDSSTYCFLPGGGRRSSRRAL